MKLTVNGEVRETPGPQTVRALVAELGFGGRALAVEVNRRVVRRKDHDRVELRDGDVVEIVTLVGGG